MYDLRHAGVSTSAQDLTSYHTDAFLKAMIEVHTRIRVDPDHRISGVAPHDVPPGEHEVTITLASSPARLTPTKHFSVEDLPRHDLGPWPEGLSLRREDIYDEDGR